MLHDHLFNELLAGSLISKEYKNPLYKNYIFSKYKFAKFEGVDVKIPVGVDDYLMQSYGDIDVELSDSEKVSHHFVYSYDIEKVREQYENSNN